MDAVVTRGATDRVAGLRDGEQELGPAHAKKNELKPWRVERFCIPPEKNAPFVSAMEDVLDVYHLPYDATRPVVCFDETSKQLVAHARTPIPPRPGTAARVDDEYKRLPPRPPREHPKR